MPATTYERQPLVHFVGAAITDPEETKNGGATKFRFVQQDGFGDDANKEYFDVVATKDVMRDAIKAHLTKGTKIAISGTTKRDDYDPQKPRFTIFPVVISLAQNIKSLDVPQADEF